MSVPSVNSIDLASPIVNESIPQTPLEATAKTPLEATVKTPISSVPKTPIDDKFKTGGDSGSQQIENFKAFDPFAEENDDKPQAGKDQNYIHIRIQQRNGRKTLTTVQGLPTRFDQKKILKVIKKQFACNGTIVNDTEMGEVIQLQGDQRKDVEKFLYDRQNGLGLAQNTIKVHGF